MARQRVCRTALEQRQTRGDVPAMTASAGRAARSAYISTSITVGVPIPGHGGSTPDQAYFTRCHSVWQPNAPAAVPSIDAETTGTSSISLEGHSNRDTLPMLQFPDLYRSATCSVMKVAAKEEVREQHNQRHVIRQPGLRSTESMHGRTIVRLTESLAVLASRRPVSLSRSNWQLRTSRCRAKPKRFGWSESNSPETGGRLE